MALELRKFNPREVSDFVVVVVVGKRNSGKSILVRDILHSKKHIPCGIVMSGSEEGNGFYQTFVPPAFVYNRWCPEVIQSIIKRQKQSLKKTGTAPPMFVVIDDLVYDKKFLNTELMRFLVMNGRHFKIFLILTVQYIVDINPAIRSNTDVFICLRDNVFRDKLYKHVFPIFPSLDAFHAAMDVCTNNYGALVFDNTKSTTNISECIFYYRARVDHKFRMCAPEFWAAYKMVRAPDSDDDEESKPASKRTQTVVRCVTSSKKK